MIHVYIPGLILFAVVIIGGLVYAVLHHRHVSAKLDALGQQIAPAVAAATKAADDAKQAVDTVKAAVAPAAPPVTVPAAPAAANGTAAPVAPVVTTAS